MPRGDQTGPMGMGAMTGRGRGICAGYGSPGYTTAPGAGVRAMGTGFRRGAGMGGGRRFRRGFPNAYGPNAGRYGGYYGLAAAYPSVMDPEIEKQALRSQADAVQRELDAIHKRLHAIESTANPNQNEKG